MRKFIYSALAMGAAFGIAFGAQTADVAAEGETQDTQGAQESQESQESSSTAKSVLKDAYFDLDGDILCIGSTASMAKPVKQIQVGIAKGKGDKMKVSAWDTYVGDSAIVDLSKNNKTKELYIWVKADFEDDADAYKLKIPASDTIKAKYDKKTGEIKVEDKAKNPIALSNVNYRIDGADGEIGTGRLDVFDANLKETYQKSGGVIYVSTPKTAVTGEAASDQYANRVLAKRPSKEVKLTIGKLANAPKVKANYVKGEITIPKGAWYRTYNTDAEAIPATQAALDKATAFKLGTATNTAKLTIDGSKDFAVDVQTAADTAKGKLASKVGHYVFDKQEPTSIAKVSCQKDGKDDAVESKGKVTLTVTNSDADNAYTLTYWQKGKEEVAQAKTAKLAAGNGKTTKLSNIATGCGIAIQRQGVSKKGEEAWAGTTVVLYEGTNADAVANGVASTDDPDDNKDVATHSITFTGSAASDLQAACTITDDKNNEISDLTKVAEGTKIVVKVTIADIELAITGSTAESDQGENIGTSLKPSYKYTYTFTMGTSDVTIAMKS